MATGEELPGLQSVRFGAAGSINIGGEGLIMHLCGSAEEQSFCSDLVGKVLDVGTVPRLVLGAWVSSAVLRVARSFQHVLQKGRLT